jgi:hypothetical protein
MPAQLSVERGRSALSLNAASGVEGAAAEGGARLDNPNSVHMRHADIGRRSCADIAAYFVEPFELFSHPHRSNTRLTSAPTTSSSSRSRSHADPSRASKAGQGRSHVELRPNRP